MMAACHCGTKLCIRGRGWSVRAVQCRRKEDMFVFKSPEDVWLFTRKGGGRRREQGE